MRNSKIQNISYIFFNFPPLSALCWFSFFALISRFFYAVIFTIFLHFLGIYYCKNRKYTEICFRKPIQNSSRNDGKGEIA